MLERLPTLTFRCLWTAIAALSLLAAPALARRPKAPARANGQGEGPRLTEERSGSFPTHEGLRLRLITDLGNVRILTQNSSEVSFRVHIETDAREPNAKNLLSQYSLSARNTPAGVQLTGEVPWHNYRGRLAVSFEVRVPRTYSLDIVTQAGSIQTDDIDGRVSLVTSGGNITAGRIGSGSVAAVRAGAAASPLVRLETSGGHISVQDVAGDLRAITAGGHITVGNVLGDALIKTGGGHIRVATIQGAAQFETGGGNISVQRTSGNVVAGTGGGQIEFGEAGGSIRAHTAGGGIRVQRVAGPMQVESGGGSIYLPRVQSAVRASTGVGSITAWLTPEAKLVGASQLESGQGDIVVYLPRLLPINIEATIESASDHRIEADPSMPLKVEYLSAPGGGRAVHGACSLNGGGETLKLKTNSGNIRLRVSETGPLGPGPLGTGPRGTGPQGLLRPRSRQPRNTELPAETDDDAEPQPEPQPQPGSSDWKRVEELQRKLEELVWGGIRVNSESQQKRLTHHVRPVYPDVARQAGLQGTVVLRLLIGKDGKVEEIKTLSGERVLAKAAADAVHQWRYQPTVPDGKPVNVVTTVTVEFRLR